MRCLTVPLNDTLEKMADISMHFDPEDMIFLSDNIIGDLFSGGYNTPYGEIFSVPSDSYDESYTYMEISDPEILKLQGETIIYCAVKELKRVCAEQLHQELKDAKESGDEVEVMTVEEILKEWEDVK